MVFQKTFVTSFWVSILAELQILPPTPRGEKLKKTLFSWCSGGKVWFYLPHLEKIGKIEKIQKFHFRGLLIDVFIWFWHLGQIFIPNFKCHKQKSQKGSNSWILVKFRKSSFLTPHCARKKILICDSWCPMGGYSIWGLNL